MAVIISFSSTNRLKSAALKLLITFAESLKPVCKTVLSEVVIEYVSIGHSAYELPNFVNLNDAVWLPWPYF